MKKELKPVIVVEGKSDVNKLHLLIDCDFVTTNGSEVSRETIEYIRNLAKFRQIIILTDPDYPGQRIRNILNQEIKGCYNAFVRKEKSIKHHKVGVAECDDEEILNALKNMIKYEEIELDHEILTNKDLFDLGLNGTCEAFDKRKFISEYYHLGNVNSKSLLKYLNMLNISVDELKGVLEEYDNRK